MKAVISIFLLSLVCAQAATRPPEITVQPKSITAAPKTVAKFSVEATGSSLHYIWFRYPKGGRESMVGSDRPTYEHRVLEDGDNGSRYNVIIWNRAYSPVSSNLATLTVTTAQTPTPTPTPPTPTPTATLTATPTSSPSPSSSPTSSPSPSPSITPTPSPSTTPIGLAIYPKGVWTSYGAGSDVPPELTANLGIVGIGVPVDWAEIETADGKYDWTKLDNKIAKAKAAGFHNLGLGITNSTTAAPPWLIAELKAAGKTISLRDPGHEGTTFCEAFDTCLPWDARFHSKRFALIAAAGKKYASDPDIKVVYASFMNHRTLDWNIMDSVFDCNLVHNDQPSQWLEAGFTRAAMLQIGKEIADAVAVAFPNQSIKLPIGGLDDSMANTSPDPRGGVGNYSTLAWEIANYVDGRPYADRFNYGRNVVASGWGPPVTTSPPFGAEGYIKYLIWKHSPHSFLQTVTSVSMCVPDGKTPCRVNSSQPTTDLPAVMQAVLNVMLGYKTSGIEVWSQDAQNPAFYKMISDATIAMGGTPRSKP